MAGPRRASEETDRRWMAEAVRLAEQGVGRTRPNPAVGAVVVRDGRRVGAGFHRRAGEPHAEVVALRKAGRRAEGATLYVTLEPCCHQGRTGPCVDVVLASGCRRVVVGVTDPNPRVRGRGIRKLRRAGVEVDRGVLWEECRRLIQDFEKVVTRNLPWTVLKLATTLDGRIATRTGDSRWVTGPTARRKVHELRNRLDAVLVGSETVVRDDPRLDCRIRGGRDPLRVVLDGRLRVRPEARLFGHRPEEVLLYTRQTGSPKARRLAGRGVRVCRGGGDRPGSLRQVMTDLAGHGVLSVFVEGGGRVAARALREGLVDQVLFFVAPKLIGADGRPGLGPLGVQRMAEAWRLEDVRIERMGEDLLVDARPVRSIR